MTLISKSSFVKLIPASLRAKYPNLEESLFQFISLVNADYSFLELASIDLLEASEKELEMLLKETLINFVVLEPTVSLKPGLSKNDLIHSIITTFDSVKTLNSSKLVDCVNKVIEGKVFVERTYKNMVRLSGSRPINLLGYKWKTGNSTKNFSNGTLVLEKGNQEILRCTILHHELNTGIFYTDKTVKEGVLPTKSFIKKRPVLDGINYLLNANTSISPFNDYFLLFEEEGITAFVEKDNDVNTIQLLPLPRFSKNSINNRELFIDSFNVSGLPNGPYFIEHGNKTSWIFSLFLNDEDVLEKINAPYLNFPCKFRDINFQKLYSDNISFILTDCYIKLDDVNFTEVYSISSVVPTFESWFSNKDQPIVKGSRLLLGDSSNFFSTKTSIALNQDLSLVGTRVLKDLSVEEEIVFQEDSGGSNGGSESFSSTTD